MSEPGAADAIRVVRGEMHTWSDLDARPSTDPVLAAVVRDADPGGDRALVAGPHAPDVVAEVAARHRATTVLVRSVADARRLAAVLPASCDVVAGSLDGLEPGPEPGFDTLVAADGLDRVLGTDAPDLDWSARLDRLRALGRDDAVLLLGVENEASVTALLDLRPVAARHGDEEWLPLHGDPTRPTTAAAVADVLAHDDPRRVRVLALSCRAAPEVAVDVAALAADRASWAVRTLADAVSRQADPAALLAPVDDALDRLLRAGHLADSAPAWLAVVTASAGDAPARLLSAAPASSEVLVCTADDAGWAVPPTGDGPAGTEPLRVAAPGGVVPDGPSVEDELLALAAAEDVPAFRGLADRIGRAARDTGTASLLAWDLAVLDGPRPAQPAERWEHRTVTGPDDALGVAWARFAHRLLARPHRHPWPPWMGVPELTATFWAMSRDDHADPDPGAVATALGTSAALARARGERTPDHATPAEALAAAASAQERVVELTGVVGGLERTLDFRDRSLRRQQARLDDLRARLKAERARRLAVERSLVRRAVRGVGRRVLRR